MIPRIQEIAAPTMATLKAYLNWRKNTPNGRAYKRRSKESWRKRNLHKARAHNIVWRALGNGKLVKQPCSVCGTQNDVQAHHPDHSKPLEVVWLCRKHHKELHLAEIRRHLDQLELI